MMLRIGVPRRVATAIEGAASLGSIMMPPVMDIVAFLMPDFMDVSYFDIVKRTLMPTLIYYMGVTFSTT